jgi:hypothetical protein
MGFHIVGYALAINEFVNGVNVGFLDPTNQNTTLSVETTKGGMAIIVPAANRVLIADAILSVSATVPCYANPGNNYSTISGGFMVGNVVYPHTSPHIKGSMPEGGDVGYKDGHATWHKFNDALTPMTPRTISGADFWW